MGYKNFIQFMNQSKCIISDSGTAQEEPALINKPVLVPRDFTERPESVYNGCSKMLEVEKTDINKMLQESILFVNNFKCDNSWLGSGNTSQKIIDILKSKV
jgi:UDP-N-acetylglucosamine 2-epimerase (non-hydrolysing)